MIYEVHRKVNNNVGDFYCNPSRYFNFDNCTSGELMHNKFPVTDKTVLIGGGGLIHKKFQLHIQNIINKDPKHTVLWGIGHNFGKKHVSKVGGDVYYPDWIKKCSLVGIRDWIDGYHNYYLPCVTCMHPAFNKQYKTIHDVVYFTHAFKSRYEYRDNDIHMKNNEMNFEKVISFLASGDTVITDSYHGVYWAQLLGKRVKTVSWSVKFNHMKHQPKFIDNIYDTDSTAPLTPDGFLDECKYLNKNFFQRFLNL